MKRGRGDALTGGSGDVNPQVISVNAAMTAANTSIAIMQPIPIPRLPTKSGKNLVIELLGVEYFSIGDQLSVALNSSLAILTTTSSLSPTIVAALGEPRQLSQFYRQIQILTAVGVLDTKAQFYDDLTDGAGHGLLLATDQFYIQLYSIGKVSVDTYAIKIYYRWKEVSLVEYIGIVQSQQ